MYSAFDTQQEDEQMTKILTCYLKDIDTFNGRFKWLWTNKSTLRKKKEEFLDILRTHFKQQQSAIHKEFPKNSVFKWYVEGEKW